MPTKNAVWFSRHTPTKDQREDLRERGFTLVGVEEGMTLGALNLDNDDGVRAVTQRLSKLCAETSAHLIVGVFPTPLLGVLHRIAEGAVWSGRWPKPAIPCWAAWNVARSQEGEKPTFEHRQFVQVGTFSQPALED